MYAAVNNNIMSEDTRYINSRSLDEEKQKVQTLPTTCSKLSSCVNTQNNGNHVSSYMREALTHFEDKDMKYAELTHRQLTNSLQQIQKQNTEKTVKNEQSAFNDNLNIKKLVWDEKALPGIESVSSIGLGVSKINFPAKRNPLDCNLDSECDFSDQPKTFCALEVQDKQLYEKEVVILELRLHISSLEHQIQELETSLQQMRKPTPHLSDIGALTFASYNRFQEQKVDDLEQLLGKKENKLFELTLQYNKEKKDLKKTIKKLENALKLKEQNCIDLEKQHKLNLKHLDKCKCRISSLERYLSDLPTIEETKKLQTEANLLGKEQKVFAVELLEYRNKLELKKLAISEKESRIMVLNKDIENKQNTITSFQETLSNLEKSKEALDSDEIDELKDLRTEVIWLKNEKKNACLLLSTHEERMKQQEEVNKVETDKLRKKVYDFECMNEGTRRELQTKQMVSNKINSSMKNLISQNQQLLDEKVGLQEKVKHLEEINSNMEEVVKLCSRLQHETNSAAQDLRELTQVLLQTANGADPNISALLGVRSDSSGWEQELTESPGSNLACDADFSTDLAEKRLDDMRQLRKDIDHLRCTLTEQYASAIGNNCITQ